jgi:beta-N-acetylhexosaminidase
VDFSFAPVLDLDHGNSSVIGNRAFHSNPTAVVELAGSLIQGMHKAGMKCVGKHFPGHGFVVADSHLDLPIDNRSMDDLLQDITPFKNLMNHGLDALMPAHVVYPQVDDKPAGFSAKWIKDILQGQLKFKGVIFSLVMVSFATEIRVFLTALSSLISKFCVLLLIINLG